MKILYYPKFYLSSKQVAFVAYNAGFRGNALVEAVAVAGGESSFDSEQFTNSLMANGKPSEDRGLWQISKYWHGPEGYEQSDEPYVTDAQAYNPWICGEKTYELSRKGTNWSAWYAWRDQTPAYLEAKALAVVAAPWVENGGVAHITVKVEGRTPIGPGLIAAQLGTSAARIVSYNPWLNTRQAKPGEKIVVPRGIRPARVFAGPR